MNRHETIALFMECEAKRKEALAGGKSKDEAHEAAKACWNDWADALLLERRVLEEDGRWPTEQDHWHTRAKTDFSRCLFLDEYKVNKDPESEREKKAKEVERGIRSIAVGTKGMCFDGFVFPGFVSFGDATFTGRASFERTTFADRALFRAITFHGDSLMRSVFGGQLFTIDTSFRGASFDGMASFEYAKFPGPTRFDGATFNGNAWFDGATFTETVWFEGATFGGDAHFNSAVFNSYVSFGTVTFAGDASFGGTTFSRSASFVKTTFVRSASFRGKTFTSDIFFNGARFGPGRADFSLATFEGVVQLDGVTFTGGADFNAVSVKRAFSMADARFERVPDFIQAHFEEAPRLDNVHVEPPKGLERLTEEEARNLFARWRALKRLAIQAHDTDRELEFNAQEIRAERVASRWPRIRKFRDGKGWREWVRSLSGWLYGLFSDYGRSLSRPFLAWVIGIVVFAAFYISQTEVMQRELVLQDSWAISEAVQAGGYALSNSVPCYPPPPTPAEHWRMRWRWRGAPLPDPNQTRVDGLSEKLRSQTNVRAEALHLAFRNAFVVLDGGSDASHRMYGCLYGLELYAGQNPVPIVPSAVSTASAIQKLISGVLIFLFGLALRNMLKVK